MLDGRDTGERFTFQDFMGVGAFLGKTRRMNVELGVKHYSNGNIFTENPGIKIPLTLTLGLSVLTTSLASGHLVIDHPMEPSMTQ